MAYDDIVRNGVALANTITASLQTEIELYAWTGSTIFGEAVYGPLRTITALVEQKQRLHTLQVGTTIMTRAKITILQPILPTLVAGRTNPIDTRDKIILPDGTTSPIVDVEGLIDPDTQGPYLYEIWLGISSSLGR